MLFSDFQHYDGPLEGDPAYLRRPGTEEGLGY